MVNDSGSPNAVEASWNEIPCFLAFVSALAESHSNRRSIAIYRVLDDAPRRSRLIQKRERSRHWMVIDPGGELVCLTVYKRGAMEVVRRLAG
jgi:hypothetical protein